MLKDCKFYPRGCKETGKDFKAGGRHMTCSLWKDCPECALQNRGDRGELGARRPLGAAGIIQG